MKLMILLALTKDKNIAVRFIEEMPFNGKGQRDTRRKLELSLGF